MNGSLNRFKTPVYVFKNIHSLPKFMLMDTIYLDHAATTPVSPGVIASMKKYWEETFGNPSSAHKPGRMALTAVENSRIQIAKTIGVDPSEIIFTSGGTEGNNAALFSVLSNSNRSEIITTKTEHQSVLQSLKKAEKKGFKIIYAKIDESGRIDTDDIKKKLSDQTALLSLMRVNNETGLIHPIAELSVLCKSKGAFFHCDAVQSVGKQSINVRDLPVDFLVMSAHKFNGPKGIGLLYVKSGFPWTPYLSGGAQEQGRRGGTVNVPGVIGMAKAFELAEEEREARTMHIHSLRKGLIRGLKNKLGGQVSFNGDVDGGIPHILSATFTDQKGRYLDGEMLLLNLDMEGVYCSAGSACSSGSLTPSHVMLALGHSEKKAKSTLRFSMGHSNTLEEIERVTTILKKIVERHSLA